MQLRIIGAKPMVEQIQLALQRVGIHGRLYPARGVLDSQRRQLTEDVRLYVDLDDATAWRAVASIVAAAPAPKVQTSGRSYTVHSVLAGAYAGRAPKLDNTLLHASADDGDTALCGRVKAGNLCDQVEPSAPTCKACLGLVEKSGGRRVPAGGTTATKRKRGSK